ncbi:MAG: nickel pincer cofactor biosynthesis protein LarC [Terrimicrobiaceae bacterium]|nr:nickel pincer cofactor biosynthesis protein LarC [Terrimicrobiaceae bacterium]
MRTLFLDCFSGIGGDMAVGALCDLGADQKALASELEKLGLGGEFHLHFSRQIRCGIEGVKFDVHLREHSHSHGHPHHDHGDEPHAHGRSFADIRALIEAGGLSSFVKSRAVAVFQRIAVAEGKIHGMLPEEVHFHEVGAVDSIVDIVAFCLALESLGAPRVIASALVEGTGTIHCAHGHFPLPAPATLEILAGIPLGQIEEPMEFITPTGAALLAEFAVSFGPMPALAVERIGYGAGTRDTPHRPNVLRAVLGETSEDAESDTVTEIESNLDDLSPELLAAATAKLLDAGALDVFVAPIHMKKNRPAFRLTVLTEPARADEFARLILRETSAFGVRMHDCRRLKLRREIVAVGTPFGAVEIKRGWLGDELVQAAPEFESCRRAAEAAGASVREVYLAAQVAAKA